MRIIIRFILDSNGSLSGVFIDTLVLQKWESIFSKSFAQSKEYKEIAAGGNFTPFFV